jgi:hypothetical protein
MHWCKAGHINFEISSQLALYLNLFKDVFKGVMSCGNIFDQIMKISRSNILKTKKPIQLNIQNN